MGLLLVDRLIMGNARVNAESFACTSAEVRNKAVYVDSTMSVRLADASTSAKMPAIGFVCDKESSTKCTVVFLGMLSGFSGLNVHKYYYVSAITPGEITDVPPISPNKIQVVGYSLSAKILLVFPGEIQEVPAHASSHENGGADEIEIVNLGTAEMNAALVLAPNGFGGVEFRAESGGGGDSGFPCHMQYSPSVDTATPLIDVTAYANVTLYPAWTAVEHLALRCRRKLHSLCVYTGGASYDNTP